MKRQGKQSVKSKKIKSFWYNANRNIGDSLTPIIVGRLLKKKVVWSRRNDTPKLLAVGSIMKALRNGDVVWGAGIMREYDKFIHIDKCKFLAVRGKLTEKILGIDCGVYGDPAILLPLLFNPKVEKKYKLGIIEHYVDRGLYRGEGKRINVLQTWKTFIIQLLQCKRIISSSLHGCIIAEAYGVPVDYLRLSDKVLGSGFKFRDYLTATDRTEFNQPFDLQLQQNNLIKVLKDYYL
jgi:pyruvyltransferase